MPTLPPPDPRIIAESNRMMEEKRRREQLEYDNSPDGRREKALREIAERVKALEDLRRIAEAAEADAELARKEARSASIRSNISISIAAVTLLILIADHMDDISMAARSLFAVLRAFLEA